MKKFIFDIQRFDDLATVSFGSGTASISSGINVTTDRKRAIGSDNDDTIVSSDNVFYLTEGMISLGGGKDSIDIDNNYAITASNVTISAGEDNDTIKLFCGISGIEEFGLTPPISIDGGDGDDYIDIGAGDRTAGINSAAVTVQGGSGDDSIKIGGESSQCEGIYGATNEIIVTNGNIVSAPVSIDGGEGNDYISIYGGNFGIMSSDAVTINGGTGSDVISIYGGNGGIGYSAVSIDGGEGSDTIAISSIYTISGGVSIIAGSGDNISVGSGGANYLFDSTDKVTINGATFTANSANTSASLFSSADTTSIKSAWNGTIALSGTNSLADIDGSIVSAAGNYQIVDGKLASSSDILIDTSSTVTPVTTETITVTSGKNYDIIFIIDISGSMDDYIDDVKANVKNFATSLRNSGVGNIRFGLISYETEPTAQTFSNEGNVYLTSDVDEFKTAVDNLSTYGGTEYGLTALETAMSIVSDEDDTTKRFIVVTDEDCDDSSMFNATNIDNTLKSRGIVMDVVGSEGSCRTEWEPLANGTNGKFYLLGSGFPSIFNKITTDIINIVDLNLVPENQTGYFVATQNSDTYTTPIFQTNGASFNDTTVGSVTESNFYVADSDTDRQQTIILTNGWNVTATKNDDKLLINGESATVTGGDGEDVFSLGSDTKSVTLLDLNIYEDKISFGNYIMPGTMRQSIEDNHLVLSADDLRVDIPAMSEMTDEFLDYNVSNAGNTATIRELINGDGKAIISFAHWSFTFNQTAFEQFGF